MRLLPYLVLQHEILEVYKLKRKKKEFLNISQAAIAGKSNKKLNQIDT